MDDSLRQDHAESKDDPNPGSGTPDANSDSNGNRLRLSRRTLLGGLGTVSAAGALGGMGTMALFRDTENSTGNHIVVGKFDLKVDWQQKYYGPETSPVYGDAGRPYVNAYPDEDGDGKRDDIRSRDEIAQSKYGTDFDDLDDGQQATVEDAFRSQFADLPDDWDKPIIELDDVKPGDRGEVEFSLHLFDNPGYVQMTGDLRENAENGVTEPELDSPLEDDTGDGTSEGELAQAIQVRIVYGDGQVLASGSLNDVLGRLRSGIPLDGDRDERSRQCLQNSTTDYVTFEWRLPKSVGNEVQSDSVTFDLGFYAEQCRHNTGEELEPFEDELPTPGTIDRRDGGTVNLQMQQSSHEFHSDLPETAVWGYDGGYLGPTIEAERNTPVTVEYENDLPTDHLLPVDTTLHGADGTPTVRNVPHLHGGNVPDDVDGWPDAWVTPDGQVGTGPGTGNISGDTITYEYPNTQPATQLWYHDHALGATRLNVYAGLAGLYTLRDDNEQDLLEESAADDEPALPSGEYEKPLVMQDKSFNEDGSLFYPDGLPVGGSFPQDSASAVPEFFGDTAVVNGKVWPYMEVEPRKYRFRMLNACNSRFLNLKLVEWDPESDTFDLDSPGPKFTLIGTDGGLLESPVEVEDRLLFNLGERADVVIDFSDFEGQSFLLHNDAKSPFKAETQDSDEQPLPEIMLFRVKDEADEPDHPLPDSLGTVPDLGEPDNTRTLGLEEAEDEYGRLLLLLNDDPTTEAEFWDDPITESPTVGTTEQWNLVNLTEDVHPIHLHLVQFQIVERQPFDAAAYLADREAGTLAPIEDYYTGDPIPLAENQQGWHDLVAARPGEITRIKAHFGEVEADGETLFEEYTGEYPWHCHILEHEDHEMMRPYEVTEP